MYNYINTTLVLLVRLKLLTEDAGRHLSGELQSKIHTSRYDDAVQMLDGVLKNLEEKDKKVLAEPWMAHIRKLEEKLDTALSEIENLKKELAKPKSK